MPAGSRISSAVARELNGQGMDNRGEVGGDTLIAIYYYFDGVSVTGQVSTPVIEAMARGGYCLKANLPAAAKGVSERIRRRANLAHLYRAITFRADVHGQRETSTRSASLNRLGGE